MWLFFYCFYVELFFCIKIISPVIWVSISPCICNESTKILRLPMKRAQAIPLYGWQKPSSSKSSLKHEQRREYRNLRQSNTDDFYRVNVKPAATHRTSTRGQYEVEECTWMDGKEVSSCCSWTKRSPFGCIHVEGHMPVHSTDVNQIRNQCVAIWLYSCLLQRGWIICLIWNVHRGRDDTFTDSKFTDLPPFLCFCSDLLHLSCHIDHM